MDYGKSIDLKEARVTFVSALAWRAIAELARRHGALYDLSLEQYHPGASVRGVIALRFHAKDTGRIEHQIAFNLGGPSGTYSVTDQLDVGALTGLTHIDPKAVIDRIERDLALPAHDGTLPPSNARSIQLRVVAELLERLAFDVTPWRATLGVYAWSGGHNVQPWTSSIQCADPILPLDDASRQKYYARLSAIVLVHAAPNELSFEDDPNLGKRAIAVDLQLGTMYVLHAHSVDELGQCERLYVSHSRSARRLVSTLVERLV